MPGTPLLGLRMKGSLRLRSLDDPQNDLVDQVKVMASQDALSYTCSDYLARRARHNDTVKYEDEGEDCPMLIDEDLVDAVCREKMCEWAYRVCDHFHTGREIVAVSFSYLDRFSDRCNCDRTAFKLAAMTSLYMATKIFNTRKVTLRNLVELSKGEFEEQHILEMEMIMLKSLSWRLNPPTVQCFVEPFCAALPISDPRIFECVQQRAIFFAELALYDYNFVPKERATVAVACILNAIEGLEGCGLRETRESNFLAVLEKIFGMQFDSDKVAGIQQRLWYVYSMSAQYQEDEATSFQDQPIDITSTAKVFHHAFDSSKEHSPVCVIST